MRWAVSEPGLQAASTKAAAAQSRRRFISGSGVRREVYPFRRYHSRMNTPNFPQRDPVRAGFWDLRYEACFAPWDARQGPGAPARIRGRRRPRAQGAGPGLRQRARRGFLAQSGWDRAGNRFQRRGARRRGAPARGPTRTAFAQRTSSRRFAEAPFAVVYERAFLCALPRRLWVDWARRVAELVAPGGLLAGFFYFDAGDRGPPFASIRRRSSTPLLARRVRARRGCPRWTTRSRCSRARSAGRFGGAARRPSPGPLPGEREGYCCSEEQRLRIGVGVLLVHVDRAAGRAWPPRPPAWPPRPPRGASRTRRAAPAAMPITSWGKGRTLWLPSRSVRVK